ncbi:MAG: hypothetical protein ACR2FV_01730 [Ornithinimicrobium sp.]|jgi:hypothetical protein|uniref:hypothetical protein n=1 Tax=Ornithinimicrobium sp. TaxID=1977084 RepID=UPI0017EAFCC1|nr:hypothetical protein [Actinomycetota bacterium]
MAIRNRPAYEAGLVLDEQVRPGSIRGRRARVDEPHVADLNTLAGIISTEVGVSVPLVDPAGGGNRARVLVFLEEHIPCRSAGTGLVSLHANDPTAANTMTACAQAGLEYAQMLLWQVIPWWTGDPGLAGRASGGLPRREQARLAGPYVVRLLGSLPRLEAVVLLGRRTQVAWDQAMRSVEGNTAGELRVMPCPHTSPMAWHMTDRRTGRPHREMTVDVLARAAGR